MRRIPSDVYRELLVSQLAEVVGMSAARLDELLGGAPGLQPGRAGTRRQLAERIVFRTKFKRLRAPERPGGRAVRHLACRGAGRGNLVRQAVRLLVHYPAAATAISGQQIDAVAAIDRPGIPLLAELLAQLREDPPASTAALLERWRDRPEHGSLSKLAAAVCLAPDAAGAAAELNSALNRLIVEESPVRRLRRADGQGPGCGADDAEKLELQGLLRPGSPTARSRPEALDSRARPSPAW